MPALPSSPATLTWIRTSTSLRRLSAESEATEWISRTRGATFLTLRLCSAPMNSQVNRSPCASCLATSSSTSGPMASRTRWRFAPTRSGSIADDHPRLPAGDAIVAPVREEELGMAARAQVDLPDLPRPVAFQLIAGDGAKVQPALPAAPEGTRHLLPHLVAATADTGAD